MTTELPDSLSLAERLKLGAAALAGSLDITRQLLEALGCIHQQSFVHCGITPENHPVRPQRLLQTGRFLSGPPARSRAQSGSPAS